MLVVSDSGFLNLNQYDNKILVSIPEIDTYIELHNLIFLKLYRNL